MKTPAFWYKPVGLAARLLSPLEVFYRAGAIIRSVLAHPYQAGVPVICVGNVVAGGSGKTPTALALAAILQQQGQQPAFVTRGYGGSQRGPLQVDKNHHSAEEVGDEAMLLLRQAPVWIGRDRAAVIREAEKFSSHILMDDGLQNPNVKPDIALMVVDGAVGLGNGHVIPAGPLREPLARALQRVTAILMVGEGSIPDLGKPVFRAHLQPVIPEDFPKTEKFLSFAGIGRPEKFYDVCRKTGLTLVATQDFADHHVFSQTELDTLEKKARSLDAKLLTTEKDYVRLPAHFRNHVRTLPIKLVFEDDAAIVRLLTVRAQ